MLVLSKMKQDSSVNCFFTLSWNNLAIISLLTIKNIEISKKSVVMYYHLLKDLHENLKKRMKKNFLVYTVCTLLLHSPFFSHASEITDGVKKTIDSIIEVVSKEEFKSDDKKTERQELIRKIVEKKFSYPEMSRRSLAKHWKERTPEEKSEFTSLFGNLLESSYARKIEGYTDEKIIYVDEKVKGNVALVKTIIQKSNDEIPVDYKLTKVGNDWKIYDFIVEGVSMIKNYRTQFRKIIRKSSYQELVKKLKVKVENINKDNEVKSDNLSS